MRQMRLNEWLTRATASILSAIVPTFVPTLDTAGSESSVRRRMRRVHESPLIPVLLIVLALPTATAFAARDDGVFARVQSAAAYRTPTLVEREMVPLTTIQGGVPRTVPGSFALTGEGKMDPPLS